MTSKLKNIIIILVVGTLLFLGYSIFFKKDPTVDPLVEGVATANEAQILGNQISQALLRIEQIKLDRSIFDDILYKTLVDRSEPISEEPIGRTNPFAPIGDISANVSNTQSTPSATSSRQATGVATSTTSVGNI